MVLSLDSIFSQYPILLNIIPIVILIFISYVAFKFSRILLIKILIPQIKKSKTQLDDSFIKNKLFMKISYVVPIIIIYNFSFIITDNLNEVKVQYLGILPDLFKEESGIVVEGKLNNDTNIRLTG